MDSRMPRHATGGAVSISRRKLIASLAALSIEALALSARPTQAIAANGLPDNPTSDTSQSRQKEPH